MPLPSWVSASQYPMLVRRFAQSMRCRPTTPASAPWNVMPHASPSRAANWRRLAWMNATVCSGFVFWSSQGSHRRR